MLKQVSNWYAAATFYLTAGFVIPLLVGLIYGLVVQPIVGVGTNVDTILTLIVSLAAMWGGIVYAAKYLNKAYIIKDAKKIVNLATIYMMVLFFIYYLIIGWAFGWVMWIIIAIRVFSLYFLGIKYIKADVLVNETPQGTIPPVV